MAVGNFEDELYGFKLRTRVAQVRSMPKPLGKQGWGRAAVLLFAVSPNDALGEQKTPIRAALRALDDCIRVL